MLQILPSIEMVTYGVKVQKQNKESVSIWLEDMRADKVEIKANNSVLKRVAVLLHVALANGYPLQQEKSFLMAWGEEAQ